MIIGQQNVQTKSKVINNSARGRVIATLYTPGIDDDDEVIDGL